MQMVCKGSILSACRTPIHRAVESKNDSVFSMLLEHSDIDLELHNSAGDTPLWLALASVPRDGTYSGDSYAAKLVVKGASVNANNALSGTTLPSCKI